MAEIDASRSLSFADFTLCFLLPLGRIEEALHRMRAAEKADPPSPTVHFVLAWVLDSAGRAAAHCQKLQAEHRSECLGRARLGQGKTGEAIQILEASDRPIDRRYLGYAYARAGRRDKAEKLRAMSKGRDESRPGRHEFRVTD